MKTEWKLARVGDILKIRNGYAVKSSDYSREGIPLIRQSDINGDTIDISAAKRVPTRVMEECGQYLVRKGDLLIGMSGSLGKIGRYVDEEVAIQNQRTGLLQVKSGFTAGFAKLVLKLVEQQIIAEGKGVAVQNVSAEEIENCTFPLPPEGERERIVAEIEKQFTRLDAGVASLKRVQIALKRYRASVLKAACEGDWPRTRVGDVAFDVRYGTSSKTNDNSDGVPVLRMGNILEGRLVLDKLKFLPMSHPEFPELLLKPGDLLFNRTNSAELVGKTAVYDGNPSPCSFASYLIRVRMRDGYSPDFFSYYLNSVFGRQWIASVVSQQVGQANVNGTKLKALVVPNPPFEEQQRIVSEAERRLSVIEEVEFVVNASLRRAIRLRQSVLGEAFGGTI